MKVRVIAEFYDKFHTSTLYKVGTVLDFDETRAKDVIAKKLAEPYKDTVKPEKKANAEEQKAKTLKKETLEESTAEKVTAEKKVEQENK